MICGALDTFLDLRNETKPGGLGGVVTYLEVVSIVLALVGTSE
jgi:hypothetical protein